MNRKNTIFVISVLLLAIFSPILLTKPVRAGEIYEGSNNNGSGSSSTPSPGGGGSSSAACTNDALRMGRLDCTGASWIFYKYIGGDSNWKNADINFPDEFYVNDNQLLTVTNICADPNNGNNRGFWHYGRNVMASGDNTRGNFGMTYRNMNGAGNHTLPDGSFSNFKYYTTKGSWGHLSTNHISGLVLSNPWWATYDKNQTTYQGGKSMGNGQPFQILYKGSTPLYQADHYAKYITGDEGDEGNNVFKAYQAAYKAAGKPKPKMIPNTTSAFCWGPDMNAGGRYDGMVTVSVNGQMANNGDTITVDREYNNVTFDHLIRRNRTEYNGASNNNWSINGHNGSASGNTQFQKSEETQYKSVRNLSSSKRLTPGETQRVCSTLTYNDDFDNNGTGTGSAVKTVCVTITRGKNTTGDTFQAGQKCYLEAGGHGASGCNQTIYTNSRNWSIKHTGEVYFNGEKKEVNASTRDPGNAISPYNKPAQTYGIGETCVRSHSPYTKWWFNKGDGWNSSGITLYNTGVADLANGGLPNRYDNPAFREWQECTDWYYDTLTGLACEAGSRPTCVYGGQNCRTVDNGEPRYLWHYGSDCGDGTKNWYDFNGSNLVDGVWSNNDDPDLLLERDTDNDDKVSLSKCSSMVANSTYGWTDTQAGPEGRGRSWSTVCSNVTRLRRHFHFDNGSTELYGDTNHHDRATTARSNGDTVDVTGSDGKFTITFGYIVERKETTNAVDPGADRYPVRNNWQTFESINAADGSGRTYNINGSYNIPIPQQDFDTNGPGDTSPRVYRTVTGTLYYGQVVEICGNITFGEWFRELDNGSEKERDASRTVGCIKVRRGEANCDNVVGSTGRGSEGFEFSHMYGYNVAKIGAINSTLMSNPIYTQWYPDQARTDTPAYTNTEIYARPGDTVQYRIKYCMGANYAHAVHEANGINDGGVDTTMHVSGDSTAATAASTNRVNNNKRSNYLFGDSLSTFDGTKTTPKIFNFIKRYDDGRINEEESIKDENNKNTKYSPQGVGTIYSCPIGGGTTTGTNNYYQVAGKVKSKDGNYSVSAHNAEEQYIIDGCTSNRTQSLDVGRQMSEKLQWTNMSFSNNVYHANLKADFLSGAYIRVPYNYTAKPYVTTNNSPKGTVQIGGKLTTTPGIAVFPRKNCALADGVNLDGCNTNNSSTATYATVTKPTTVTFKAYINTESRTFQTDSYVVRANTKSNKDGSTAGGAYATANLNGGGTKLDNDYVIDVPNNVNPGDKICVKMTITPADSHNDPTWATVHGASRASAGAEDTSRDTYTYWALREDGTSTATAISCSTAVKRPTISVEDSNLYSASNITTSVVSRNNYVYNGGNARNAGNLDYYLFGSWSEYGIFGKVTTGSDGSVNISTLGTASGASLGYSQTSYLNSHKTTVTGYNAQPLTVVTYNGGPKNGTYEYNYSRITHNSSQTRIVYEYETKEDGSRYYRLASKTNQTIAPSSYTFANSPIVNAADSRGVASKATKVCTHSTQTFANVDCDDGKIGSDKIGADAVDVFTTNILDRYGDAKMPYTKTDGAEVINGYTNLTETSAVAEQLDGDEGAAMFKNIKGKAFLGYKDGHAVDYDSLAVKNNGNVDGVNTNLTAKSVMVYKADTVVINSSLIANNDEKTGSGDFRMPIIIANKVWFTGNPTRVDAIIIAKEELNTCKWNSYNDFLSNVLPSFPTKKNGLASNKANEMSSNICNNELRFTAPVVVKGKLVLNRTYGAGGANGGGDQIRRAEIFELNAATYLWSFAEMSRYSQAITTYSRELPSRY